MRLAGPRLSSRSWGIPVGVFLLAALVTTTIVWQVEEQRRAVARAEVARLGEDLARSITRVIERPLDATHTLAALIRQGQGTIQDFDAIAQWLLPLYPGVAAMQLAPGGVIQSVVPLAGHEAAIGLDLLKDPVQRGEAVLARDTRQLTLTGPIDLMQGGQGAIGRLPVFLDDGQGKSSFWGFTMVLLRLPEALAPARLFQLTERGFDYHLWRTLPGSERRQSIIESMDTPLIDPIESRVAVPNGQWILSISPQGGWGNPAGVALKVAAGLLVSLLLAILARLLIAARSQGQDLEALIAQRTAEVRAREAELKRAQAIANMGSWTLDRQTDTWRWSDEAYRIFAFPPETPIDYARIRERIHPDDRDVVDRTWASALQGEDFDVEYRIQVGTTIRWVRERAQFERVPDGSRPWGIGTVQDITERKHAEEILRESEERFRLAFENANIGVCLVDPQGRFLKVNHPMCEMFGYSQKEFESLTMDRITHPDYRETTPTFMGRATTGKVVHAEFEKQYIHKQGHLIWGRVSSSLVCDQGGAPLYFISHVQDVTDYKAAEAEIKYLAFYDPLTRLPNRRLLLERLSHALAASARAQRKGALMFIDLDNFKTLNDTQGHDTGDQLLQQVAQRLTSCVRESDTVARLGGDEFVVMLENLAPDLDRAAALAKRVGEKILTTLNADYPLGDHLHHSTPSIGITLFSERREGVEDLLKQADLAMYQAKAAGRNTLCFFDPAMQTALATQATLETELRRGLQTGQLLLHYQAQVDSRGRLTGAEALVRWRHPQRGLVYPSEFVPLAETTGLILPLGHWVLNAACRQLALWANRPETSRLTLAVNISARQFHDANFIDTVLSTLATTGAEPARLKLEVTEAMLLENVTDSLAKMTYLKTHGLGFVLDHFGTGYSSLSYLKRLPLDLLKIAPSFVRDVLTDPNNDAIASTFVTLAHGLGLGIIAEGVETQAQRDYLARHGCTLFQGYLFGRPGPATDLLMTGAVEQDATDH